MINKKNYYNDLGFIAALFYSDLLNKEDIFEISNYLTNNNYDSNYLIEILLDYKNNKNKILNNFDLFLKEKNLSITSKVKAIGILINKIFKEILNNKISFMDGVKFIIEYLIDNSKNKEFIGDYLGLDEIIGIYYAIDDGDIINKSEIKKTLNLGIKMIEDYLGR